MANNASLPKPVEEMVKSSKVDPSSKISSANSASSKDETLSNATSCISSVDVVCNSKEVEIDREHLLAEQSVYYPMSSLYGYYYPGIEMPVAEFPDHGYYMGPDRLEIQQPVLQSDAGSYVYYVPGFQPGYDPYNSFVPPPMVGVDGQYLGQQPYFPCPVMSQPLGSPLYFPPVNYGPEMMQAYGQDSPVWYGNSGNGFVSDLSVPATKPKFQTKSQPSKPSSVPKVIPVETKGSSPVLGLPPRAEVPNQSLKPVNKPSPPTKGYFPVAKLPPYTYQGKGNLMYSSNPIYSKENGRSWISPDKVKGRNKPNGFSDFDSLTEQNRGPRTSTSKSTADSEGDNVEDKDKEHENESGNKSLVIRRDDYNLPDFPTKYEHASFFVIKSYSEDDIHKSIKYNVWASTPNGNKRLDGAFQAAQEKTAEKGVKCPVFLFFSVNASGQFCGLAEMLGRVDFHKSMDFWQQDKWNGFFPVKWHIIKDVPNPQFRHIILENNENKPVTNSRDTQEVNFPQGSEMLNIFKSFSSKTSILDDFGFYENRQKVMQDKRAKFSASPLEQLLPKAEESIQTKKAEDLQPIIAGIEAMELGSTELNKDKHQPTAVA